MADFTMSEAAEILVTLRTKLLRIVVIVAVVWAISFAFVADTVVMKVKDNLLPEGAKLIYRYPLEGMILKLKISLIFGFAAALPYIILLVYNSLKDRTELLSNVNLKKGAALRYITVSVILFTAGVIYGYYILRFFLLYLYKMAAGQGVLAYYTISDFINFIVLMLTIFGIIFQMPLIMTFLVGYGLVDFNTIIYYRRHLYVAFFVMGAAITPPDVFTQTIVAVPMILFFEISLIVIRIIHRSKIHRKDY